MRTRRRWNGRRSFRREPRGTAPGSTRQDTLAKTEKPMICEKCGRDYPSQYYFKTDTVCVECFAKMNPGEKDKAVYHSLMQYQIAVSFN
jgi:hypothetical protein